ncbi:MAG TPA: hypothetical protein VHC01_14495 [Gaiellaceae bacterium]|jgi:hypothetical protein|nr:hypothetical protein [Gaiellaceae bacterium]
MRRPQLETPGTLAIMLIYLALFLATWLLAFAYLAARWAIS